MTAPSYTEDLNDIATGDESSGWAAFSTNQQGLPQYLDNEYPYIQGSYAITQSCAKSKTIANMGYDYGSDTNPGTDDAIFVWQFFASAFSMDDYAGTTTGQAGMCVLIGDSASNFDIWEVGGQDVPPYPYGGFTCHAVCPSVAADDTTNGPRTSEQVIGAQINLTAYPSKGEPHSVDIMRFGRGSSIFEYGEALDYATIAGFAALNDNQSNRWGLIQGVSGGYLWQGRMQLGSVSNAVDLRDSGVTIFVKYTPKVTANFNTVEIINSGSNIEMIGFSWICLDPSGTASKGRWITTDDAPVDLTGSSWTDWATFVFDSNTTAVSCTWKRCDKITTGDADVSGSSVLTSTVAVNDGAVYYDTAYTDTNLDNMVIAKGTNAHHAIDFGTAVTSNLTLRGIEFTGFGSTGDSDDSTVRFLATSGSLTLTLVDCTVDGAAASASNFSIHDTAGITVTLDTDVQVTFTGLKDNSEIRIYKVSDDSVVAGIEDATDGSPDARTFAWTAPAATEVYYRIHNFQDGVAMYETIEIPSYTVPSNAVSIQINQRLDRNVA